MFNCTLLIFPGNHSVLSFQRAITSSPTSNFNFGLFCCTFWPPTLDTLYPVASSLCNDIYIYIYKHVYGSEDNT